MFESCRGHRATPGSDPLVARGGALAVNNNPFWGFTWLRQTMATYRRGATVSLVVAGGVLVIVGRTSPILDGLGMALVLIGAWPLLADRRAQRDASRLEAHARAEDEIVALARRIAGAGAAEVAALRPGLMAQVDDDAAAADAARRICLERARDDPAEADRWLDAANEIERAASGVGRSV